MPSPITLFLEVRPVIKSYLLALYGPEEPIVFPRKSDYNAFLVHNLRRPPSNAKPLRPGSGLIEIALPYSDFKNIEANNFLGFHERTLLREEIERDFIYDYHTFVRRKMREGEERKIATIMFMEEHNIQEEELSFSAFYRNFNRMLNKRRISNCITVI